MRNVRTLQDLQKNTNTSETVINSAQSTQSVLKLRGNDETHVRSALDELTDQHKEYERLHGNSSVDDTIIPNSDVILSPEKIWSFVKKIYNKLLNGEIKIDQDNPVTLTDLIKNEANNVNEPTLNEVLNITNSSQLLMNNSVPGLKPFGDFGEMTLNQLAVRLSEVPLDIVSLSSVSVKPLEVIGFGIIYRILSKQFIKHFDNKDEILKIKDPVTRQVFLRHRSISLGLVLCLIIPVTTRYIQQFAKTSIFESTQIKINFDKPNTELPNSSTSLLPLISLFKKKSNTGRLNGKWFKFIKWIIIIIIFYFLYKFKILEYIAIFISNNENLFKNILLYITIFFICASLVFNSLGYFILLIENDIKIDLSKIKIKFFRTIIESFMAFKDSGLNLDLVKKGYVARLYLTLFVLFTIPILFFM